MKEDRFKRKYYDLEDAVKKISAAGHKITVKDLIHWGETGTVQLYIQVYGDCRVRVCKKCEPNHLNTIKEDSSIYGTFPIYQGHILRIKNGKALDQLYDGKDKDIIYLFKDPVLLTIDNMTIKAKDVDDYLKQNSINEIEKTNKTAKLTLVELLQKITPDLYHDELSSKEKGATTKSLNTLKKQLPEAFKLSCQLVLESIPCEGRQEFLTYTRGDIEARAAESGIKTAMARQIYAGLPAVMKQ